MEGVFGGEGVRAFTGCTGSLLADPKVRRHARMSSHVLLKHMSGLQSAILYRLITLVCLFLFAASRPPLCSKYVTASSVISLNAVTFVTVGNNVAVAAVGAVPSRRDHSSCLRVVRSASANSIFQ